MYPLSPVLLRRGFPPVRLAPDRAAHVPLSLLIEAN